jgi:hypothetical protein
MHTIECGEFHICCLNSLGSSVTKNVCLKSLEDYCTIDPSWDVPPYRSMQVVGELINIIKKHDLH